MKHRPYQPRPYQQECIQALARARAEGTTAGLVEMASGLGKTLTAIFDLEQFFGEYPDARVLYVCDQEPILTQSKHKFREFFGDERSYGMFIGPDKTYHRVNFLFATFQSLKDHSEAFAVDAFDYVINDEAHHAMAPTYKPVLQHYQPKFLLGLTATPDRGDGLDILEIYQKVIFQMTIYDGWTQGWLARVDYRLMLDELNEQELKKYIEVPDGEGIKVSLAQLNRTVFAPQRDEEIVRAIREQTADLADPQICIYCSNITHAEAIAKCFAGEAALVHSKQSRELNTATLTEFRAGNIRTLISVDMLNEGYDVPQANVVVFLRATESLRIFLQQLGRGLRLISGKEMVRVLDFVVNIERISMVLEMERQVKERMPAVSTGTSVPVDPFVLNIRATKFRMERADIEKLLRSINRYRYWTDEELLAGLRMKAAELGGRMPTQQEIREDPRMASARTYVVRFGSLAQSAKRAGLEPNAVDYTDEELLELLRQKAQREGKKTVTQHDIRNDPSLPSADLYASRFGGLVNALRLAGLELSVVPPYTDEELLKLYRDKGNKDCNGEAPSTTEVQNDPNMPNTSTYFEHFENWENLRILSGLKRRKNNTYWINATDDEILEALRKITEKNGCAPTCEVLQNDPDAPSYRQIQIRFGGLPNALKKANIITGKRKVSKRPHRRRNNVSKAELITDAQKVIRENKRKLRVSDFENNPNLCSRMVYTKVFGGGIDRINEGVDADRILAELENN